MTPPGQRALYDTIGRDYGATRRADPGIDWRLADAERLPFSDGTFDGAMATLVIHHLKALPGRMREARRVLQRGRFVIFTAFPEQMRHYWLHHYFPRMIERSARAMPSEAALREALHGAGFSRVDVIPYQVTAELQDLFLYSGKQRPELYLDAAVRANISSFATQCEASELASGLVALATDVSNGAVENIMRHYEVPGGDYAFVVAETGGTS